LLKSQDKLNGFLTLTPPDGNTAFGGVLKCLGAKVLTSNDTPGEFIRWSVAVRPTNGK
jgi:hypothetical protein